MEEPAQFTKLIQRASGGSQLANQSRDIELFDVVCIYVSQVWHKNVILPKNNKINI